MTAGVLLLSVLLRLGEGFEFGGEVGGLGCADPLEDFQCLPDEGLGLGGVAVG